MIAAGTRGCPYRTLYLAGIKPRIGRRSASWETCSNLVTGLFRSRASLETEILTLRHQLNMCCKEKRQSGLFSAILIGSFLRASIGLRPATRAVIGSMLSRKGLRNGLNDDSCYLNESGKNRR